MDIHALYRTLTRHITHWTGDVLGLNAHGVAEIMPKHKKLRTSSIVGLLVTLYYAHFNLTSAGFWTLGWIQLGVAAFLLVPAFVFAARNVLLQLSETFLMASATIILGCLQIYGGIAATGIYWVYIFPFIAFFITGQRNGWLWSLGFLTLSFAVRHAESLAGLGFAYSLEQTTQQYAAFLFYTLTASLFNHLRSSFELGLHDTATEKAAAAEAYLDQLRYRALHDSLTGLPNRQQFCTLLAKEIARCGNARKVSAACVKLDRIPEISSIIGGEESARLLKSYARELQNSLPPDTLFARTGHDEFAVAFLLPRDEDETGCLRGFLSSHPCVLHVSGRPMHIEYTVGLCSYPDSAAGSDQLLRRAEQAMMHARKKHLPLLHYEPGQEEALVRHHLLCGKLVNALKSGHLSLAYQPQIDIATGKLAGAEVLARWRDPQEGWIAPAEFIPVAEQSGLIHPLTHWVIRQSFKQCGQWRRAGLPVNISLNLSPRSFDDPGLPACLSNALHESGADSGWITLELTENAFMDNPGKAMHLVGQFRTMGFHISIDDFGTGHSSLAYLKNLNADQLKIGHGFIANLPENANDAVIVQSTIQLAHNLGMKAAADGIETAAVSNYLRELGCDIAQGHHYGRPMQPDEFGKWAAGLIGSSPSPSHYHPQAA